jgi:hypothetical protein
MVDLKAEMLFHNKYLQRFIWQSCRAVMFHLTNPVPFFIAAVLQICFPRFCNSISEVPFLIVEVLHTDAAKKNIGEEW